MDVCNKREQNTPSSPWFLRGMCMYNGEREKKKKTGKKEMGVGGGSGWRTT